VGCWEWATTALSTVAIVGIVIACVVVVGVVVRVSAVVSDQHIFINAGLRPGLARASRSAVCLVELFVSHSDFFDQIFYTLY
jgi:hypothetical protein